MGKLNEGAKEHLRGLAIKKVNDNSIELSDGSEIELEDDFVDEINEDYKEEDEDESDEG